MNHPTRMKEGKKAVKRLRTIAKALVNDIARKMNENALSSYVSWLLALAGRLENVLFENEKQCACLCPTLATVA